MGGDGMVEVAGLTALSTAPTTQQRPFIGTTIADGGNPTRTSKCPHEMLARGSLRYRTSITGKRSKKAVPGGHGKIRVSP